MDGAELDFRAALQEAVNECRRIGYKPTGFMGMVTTSSAFEAVRTLLAKKEPSDGFTTLWEKGRLDLTVEAISSPNGGATSSHRSLRPPGDGSRK
jgi:hypothetical protein